MGNRTRDLLACSAVPQPTEPPPSDDLMGSKRATVLHEKSCLPLTSKCGTKTSVSLTKGVCNFPQSLQANAGLSHRLLVPYAFLCSAFH